MRGASQIFPLRPRGAHFGAKPRPFNLTQLLLCVDDFLSLWHFFVVFVEGVTARDDAVARGGRAIAKSAADQFAFHLAGRQSVVRQLGVTEHHAAQPDKIDPAFANDRLRHLRQIILQVRVAGSYQRNVPLAALHCRTTSICRHTPTSGSSGGR